MGALAASQLPLIGRDTEVAELVALLRTHRLVTVTGPGGVGKTSLALAAAAATGSAGLSVVCELAEVDDPAAVRHAVAARMGVQNPDSPLGWFVPAPRDGSAVVVLLDNCEHVLDAAAEVVEELRSTGPHLHVLTTSREPLRFADEVVLRLDPLEVPESEEEPEAASAPAILLFMRRARAARRDFDSGPEALVKIVRICRSLDGLPLALEIAAARMRSFSLEDVAAQLERRLDLPGAGHRGLPARHRTLSAVVEWSYNLLEAHEQGLFTWLCVHPAGFTAAAAVSAGSGLGLTEDQTLARLDGLVRKSLVTLGEGPGGTRYRILETLREFGLARLELGGQVVAARDQHADHYAALVRTLGVHGLQHWDEPLGDLFWEFDNVRSALTWTIDHDPVPDRAFDLLSAQWYVGLQEGSREIASFCDAAVRRWPDSTDHPRYSEVMGTASVCRLALDELDEARQRARAAIDAATSPVGTAWAWRTLAETSHHRNHVERSLEELERADDAARLAGFEPLRCDLLGLRVATLVQGHRDEEAWTCAQRALKMATAQTNAFEHAWDLHLIGMLLAESDPVAAESWLTSALEESSALHYPYGMRVSLRGLGVTAAMLGRYAEAADLFLQALDLFRQAGMRLQHQSSIAAVVPLLTRTDHRTEAAVAVAHLEATEAIVERIACPGFEAARDELAPDLATQDALARGRALTAEQVISLLSRSLRTIADEAAPEVEAMPDRGDDLASTAELERTGDLWRITYAGTTVHLPHLKGLDDLATLLARPGREVPALDLAAPLSRTPGAQLRKADGPARIGGDLGELVDSKARTAYVARLRELEQELDEADTVGDAEQAARAQAEFDALSAHLAAAYGLHGARRTGDPAERARAAVTARLRSAISRVEQVHRELGRHLTRSVRTGRFCGYHPDEPVVWTIRR